MKELPLDKMQPMGCNWFAHFYRMVAEIGLHNAYSKCRAATSIIAVQGAPKVRLLARKAIAVGELTLVPWSTSVHEQKESKSDCRVYVKVMTTPPKMFSISSPPALGKSVEVEFWRMQEEKKSKEHANMKWDTVSYDVPWPVDIGLGKTVSVEITVATNSKAIKPDHEIRVWTHSVEKKRKDMQVAMDVFDYNKKPKL